MPTINYVASPTGQVFHRDDNFGRFILGPFGSGKTTIGIMEILLRGLQQKPDLNGKRRTRAVVVRNSYPELRSTTIPSYQSWFRDICKITYGSPITAEINLPLPDGTTLEQEIFFIGLDDEQSAKKLMSLEVTFAFLDEFVFIPEHIVDVVSGRIGRFPEVRYGGPTWSGYWGTSNPCPVGHWYYVLAEEKRPVEYSFYRQPPGLLEIVDDKLQKKFITNPEAENLLWLPKDYYTKMAVGKDDDFIKVYLMGHYGQLRSGKPVYSNYKDKIHYSDKEFKPHKDLPIVIGVDTGLAGCAAVFTQLLPTGTLVIFDELFFKDMSVHDFVETRLYPYIKSNYFSNSFSLVLDPAAGARSPNNKQSAYDIIKMQFPSSVELAHTNDPLARVEAVAYFLTRMDGLLLCGPKVHMLRRGFLSEYKYEKIGANPMKEKFKEKADKNDFSHGADALQYAALKHKHFRVSRRTVTPASHSNIADSTAGY
jgi:hypothetical protein